MAKFQLTLPKMGESVSEATIVKWLKQPGDRVEEDEAILEIATDKVDSDVPSPVSGILREQLYAENNVVQVGDVLAMIEVEGEDAVAPEEVPYVPVSEPEKPAHAHEEVAATIDTTAASTGTRYYSPLVKNIASEEGITQEELDQIPGTGSEGRVTKQDVLDYLARRTNPGSGAPAAPAQKAVSDTPQAPVQTPVQTNRPTPVAAPV